VVVVLVAAASILTLNTGADMSLAAIGGLLGGVGQLAGGISGLFGGGSGTAQQQIRAQNQAAFDNLQFQRDAANFGIRWKVADAQAAGVHPLFALGAPTFNPSPVGINPVADDPRPDYSAALSNMGQGISRALASTMTKDERQNQLYQSVKMQQDITRGDLQNQLLRSQIARMQSDQIGPAFPATGDNGPLAGQGNLPARSNPLGVYKMDPPKIAEVAPGTPTAEAGPPGPDSVWLKTPTGVRPVPAKHAVQDTDIFNPEYLEWAWRNKVFPHRERSPSPAYMAKVYPGSIGARWDQWNMEWRPIYPSGGRVK